MTKKIPVFTAINRHYESCGTPPDIRTIPDCYFGYFQNQHGEQWVLKFNPKTSKGILRGGDIGWDEAVEFDLTNEDWPLGMPILNLPEQEWLLACLHAATGRPVEIDGKRLVERLKAQLRERYPEGV